MQRYLNLRTAGLAVAAAIAIVVVYPAALSYLPLLILAACPLTMLFMHGHGGHGGHEKSPAGSELGEFVCPMHPDVRSTFPGKCPICAMALETRTGAASAQH